MKSHHDSVTRITSTMALIIAVVITIAGPAFFFAISFQYMRGGMDTQAELAARTVEGLIFANPKMWQFEEIRLQEFLQRRHTQNVPEARLIRDTQGNIVAQMPEPLSPPLMTRGYDIYDAGVPVARIELSRSLLPLIIRTAIVGSVSLLLGSIIFIVLRTIPLRAVRKSYQAVEESEQELKESKEFLEALIETAPT